MLSPKAYRRLWTINGIGLLLFLVLVIIELATPAVSHVAGWLRPEHDRGLIVGPGRDTARGLDLSIQHVKYDRPAAIQGSDYHLAEVVVLDKRLPREVREAMEQAGDVSLQMLGATINVLFFRADRTDVRRLLDRNGYVAAVDYPAARPPGARRGDGDAAPERPFILYRIGLEDTDGDGRINERDAQQYYLSDLSGRNLRQATPDTLALDHHWFSDDFAEIYFEELVRDESRERSPFVLEQRALYYYNVASGRFGRFDALQEAFGEIQREFGEAIE